MCERVAWVGYGYGLGVQRRDGLCSQRWIRLPAWRPLGLDGYRSSTTWDRTRSLAKLETLAQTNRAPYDGPRVLSRRPRGNSVVSRPRATMTEPFLKAVLRLDSTSRTSVVCG